MDNQFQPLKQFVQSLNNRWKWFVGVGVLLMVVGCLALGNLFVATLVSLYYIAMLFGFSGVSQLIAASQTSSGQVSLLVAFSGILSLIAAGLMIYDPLMATEVITLMIGASLIASGILRLWDGLKYLRLTYNPWLMLSGLAALVLGALIVAKWPINSFWVIGLFLSLDVLFFGWFLFSLGLMLRKLLQK